MLKSGINADLRVRLKDLVVVFIKECNRRLLTAHNGFLNIRYNRGIEMHGGFRGQLFDLGGDNKGVL